MSVLSVSLAVAAATFSASYDCVLDPPKRLMQRGDEVTLQPIQFPGVAEGAWKFRANVEQGKNGLNVEVVWPGNPIQLAGKFAGLPTADGSIAFTTYSMGPCMFTESACMSLVNLVDFGNGNAKVIVSPAALATDEARNGREPFVVVIEGKCTRIGKPE